MCGRFTLRTPSEKVAELFRLLRAPILEPRCNIAPTQPVAAVRNKSDTDNRECVPLVWGLIPSWSKDPRIGSRMINARAETVANKPAFRAAFKRRRCLIPADGFYEWQQVGARKKKQPFWIGLQDERLFAFAGLWECWTGSDGSELESCTIITCEPNELLAPLHNRMPVILPPDDFERWLSPTESPGELQSLLIPYPPEEMVLSADRADELLSPSRTPDPPTLF